tara:strand:- start:368 stop:1228 length:861 start_codon:yes stop_codon:yes gene_type:complete
MSLNKKNIINLFYPISIIFFFLVFIIKVNSETKIIAKKGDTMFKLSKEYGVTLKALMHKNKFNDANKIIEGELIIIPLKNLFKDNVNGNYDNLNYKVKEGDTLYKIARIHNINIKDIISINNLNNISILKPKQIIILPKGAGQKSKNIKKDINIVSKKVFYHQTYYNENISDIAKLHNIEKKEIVNLNKLSNLIKINPNTKLKIREIVSNRWVKYGPLTIDSSDWTYLNGNYITRAKNKKNKPFFIAINCERRTLNNTLKKFNWKSWNFPENDFEFNLIQDFCDKD